MANFLNFSSDKPNAFLLLIDDSGSMDHDEKRMKEGLRAFKKSFDNFPEANSIAISKSIFGNDRVRLGEFKRLSEFDTSYSAYGGTPLYYAIENGAKHLKNYMSEVMEQNKIEPIGTFIVFSDGESCRDSGTVRDAKKAIEGLNYAGITTVFIAFGESMSSKFGEKLGFMSTIDVRDREALTHFLGVEFSHSFKEQSQRNQPLGANFFSGAVNSSSSAGYSATTAQALEDDSWFDDI